MLDHLPIPTSNLHPVPAPGDPGITSPDEAADVYAAQLAAFAPPPDAGVDHPDDLTRHQTTPTLDVPRFDVLLLGVGPDGHVASLFPGCEAVTVTNRAVVGVHDSPKAPPERVTLTLPAIRTAEQVWLMVAGTAKAEAVRRAIADAPAHEVPAAAACGRARTLWLLDVAAAG